MPSIDIAALRRLFEQWLLSITDPQHSLVPNPTNEKFMDGLEFYFQLLLVSLLIYGLVALFVERGSLTVKARMLASGLLGMIFFFVVAMAMHFPFWLLGGKSTFLGTCLAYIYASAPYGPLMAFTSWIMVAGMPPDLRRFALNPGTAQAAAQLATNDPETDKFTFFFGALLVWGLMVWNLFVTFRTLAFVHDLGGWALAGAIVLSFVIAVPIGALNKRMSALMFHEKPEAREVGAAGVE